MINNDSMVNPNSNLSAESDMDRLAHIESNECFEDINPDCDHTHGWPGDGSGEDDLADLMAHGDEGCCDGPEHDDPLEFYDGPEDGYLDGSWEDAHEMGCSDF